MVDKVLVLLSTGHNKLLMQSKSPFEIKSCKGGNNYQIEINGKMNNFHTYQSVETIGREG